MNKGQLIAYALIFVLVISSACGKSTESAEETASLGKATTASSNNSVTVAPGNGITEDAFVKEDPNRFKFSRTDYEEGDHVWYGRYEQDRRDSNGSEPVEWIVIAKEDDRMLLMSACVLDTHIFSTSARDNMCWADSDLRIWLNEQFYSNVFSEEEKKEVLLSKLRNEEYQSWTQTYVSEKTDDSEDYVFLLSIQEAEEYLDFDASFDAYTGTGKNVKKAWTEWASAAFLAPVTPQAILNGAKESQWTNSGAFDHGDEYAGNYYSRGYWLRSVIAKEKYRSRAIAYIDMDHIYYYTDFTKDMGIRPCIWVALNDVGSAGRNPDTGKASSDTTETAKDTTENRGGVMVKPTENASVSFKDYTSDDGYVSLKIPSGWKVRCNNTDTIVYTITVYHPENNNIKFTYTTTQTSYESQDVIDMLVAYGGASKLPISPEATTLSLFENSGKFFGYSGFEQIADLGSNGYGGSVIQAKATAKDETVLEGLFSATVIDMGTNYVLGSNVMFDLDEGIMIMTAPEADFVNWQPVLSQIFESLSFSNEYWKERNSAWAQITKSSQAISQSTKAMSDSVMSSWEKRNNSYDIRSQAYSDATLGRERIYDKETGEIYYAKNGWYDSYSGNRYERVENGSELYNVAVTGTISE